MSFVRRNDDSDVYVFDNGGQYECNYCELKKEHYTEAQFGAWLNDQHVVTKTAAEMLAHLRDHYRAGHAVPQRAFDNLTESRRTH